MLITNDDLNLWIELYNKPKWNTKDRKEMPEFSKMAMALDLKEARKTIDSLTMPEDVKSTIKEAVLDKMIYYHPSDYRPPIKESCQQALDWLGKDK